MSSLYEINEKLALYRMEFDEDGVWINEDELTELQMAKDEKRENIALYIKNIEAEAAAVKTERQVFDERYKRLINKANRLREYLTADLDGEPFKTNRVAISFRKSESVNIVDEDAVPDRFLDISIVRKPVKANIKQYLKEAEAKGEQVPWAKLEVKKNIQFN